MDADDVDAPLMFSKEEETYRVLWSGRRRNVTEDKEGADWKAVVAPNCVSARMEWLLI